MKTFKNIKSMGWQALAQLCLLGASFGLAGTAHAANVDVQVSSFTDSPEPAIRGGQITYTTVVKNGGPAIAGNVVVTWPIPANTTFVSVSDGAGGGTCLHNGATPGSVTCTYSAVLVDISSADWKTIALVIQTGASTPGTINTSATATQTDNTDTAPNNDSLTQNTTINNGADLTFAISGAPNPAVGAGNVTWAITGSNLGPDTSGPITVTVPLPGTVTYVSGSGTGWSCSGTTTISCTRAALTSGSAYPTLSIVTKISSQVSSGTLTVGGSIGQTTVGDPVSANNSAEASVTVNSGLDLGITQDVPTPASANAGGTAMTFVLRPNNLGPYDATTGANVTFPLPVGFTLTSATGTSGWTCASAGSPITVTCSLGSNLASGSGSVLTIVTGTPATVSASTPYTLTGTVAVNSGGPTDPISGNNTAARIVTVTPVGLDLGVTKTKTPAIVAQNANMTSTITVTNAAGGVATASGTISVTDVLDTTFETYVSASGLNWSCSVATVATTETVTCTYNAARTSGQAPSVLIITTKAMANGMATNIANVAYSGTPGDYNTANNGPIQSSVTVTAVPNSPDLVAGLSLTAPGGVATTLEYNETTVNYVATLTNANTTSADATDTRMTLTIPAVINGSSSLGAIGIVVTNTSGSSTATYTCSPATGTLSTSTITCNQAAATVLKPGDLVTFTVPVSRPLMAGTFPNPPNVAVTSTTQGDPTPGNNTASAKVIIDPIADIELVTKSITSANPAKAGTNVTYVLTLKNNGPSSAAGVSVSDVFTIPGGDVGFTYISAVASDSGTCSGLVANTVYGPGTATVTCNWAAVVTNGSQRTVTVVVRPNWMSGHTVRTLDNTATVSTTTPENTANTDNGNNSKTATLTINPADVDALINNTDQLDPLGYDPAAGSTAVASTNNDITYDVAVTNNGPSLVSGLGFTYTMTPPAGKTVVFRGDGSASTVASTTSSGTIAGSICDNVGTSVTGPATLTLTCTFAAPGQLASDAAVHRYLVFRVGTAPATGGDTYTTNSTVITNETDRDAANNSEGETTTVRQRVDLTIAKVPSVNPAQLRQPFNWTITLTNTGPGNSDTTTLTDTLPAGMAFFGAAPSFTTTGVAKTGTCGVSGQVMTCNISTGSGNPLNVGEVATVTVPVRMTAYPSGGTTPNCASAVTDQVDPAPGSNTEVCSTLTVQRSSIAGRVFNDPNRDGLFSYTTGAAGTDVGMNVSNIVTLTGIDAYGNPVSLTQSTTGIGVSAGAYLFNDLSPADGTGYTVMETQPATYVNGPVNPPAPTLSGAPTAGDQGVYAMGGLAGNSSYAAIKLAGNQAGTNYNFPEVRRPSLSGRVYVDVNVNDSYTNGTDTNISAATVILRNVTDLANSVATTTTLADGTYTFTNLDPLITYVLEEALPSTPAGLGNRATAVNVGTVNAVATGTAAANTPAANTDRITGIDLSAGVDGINYNFGEDLATTISGLVYNDRSRNGLKDGTEPGIEGVSLKLVAGTDCSAAAFAYAGLVNPVTTLVTTGAYSFTPVPASAQYTVCETQPIGYADGPVGGVTTSITIASLLASGSTGNNFPEVLGNISGKVFADFGSGIAGNNNNGTQQGSEPGIGSGTANLGVPVTLTGTPSAGPALPGGGVTLYTDASGDYSFIDLYAGNYTITQTAIPAALGVYNNGINTAGTVSNAGTPGTAGAVGVNTISALVLAAGSQSPANNFAKMPVTAITGTVYIDLNRNNTKEATPTDGRIGSVTLNLYQAATCTGTPVATTTTGTDGAYIFSTVSAGLSYAICETQPLGYGDAAVNPGTDATTTGSNVITIATLASTGSVGNDFGEIIGSLAGSVYRDFGGTGPAVSNNGLKEAGELGIVNVPVTLNGTDAAGASVNLSVITDAAGAYVFSNLLAPGAAGYTIAEGVIPPASGSYSDGKDTAGNASVAAGNATALNDRMSGIRIAGGENATGYNFGELEPPVIPSTFPDMVVTKTTGATRAFEGQLLNYTLRVKNAGPVVTEGSYTVTDTLPSGTGTPSKWTLESATGTGWSCTISTDKLSVSCSTATLLPPGQENPSAITLSVKVGTGAAASSPLRNVVQVSGGGEPDDKKPQPGELSSPKACAASPEFNVCQLATPIDASTPDLVVTKSASKALFTEGGTVGYVLRVKNIGQSATVGQYTVTDTLPGTTGTPAKWTLESAVGNGWTCSISADKLGVSCSHAAVLQPGEENASTIALAVKIGVGAAAFSPLINTVQITGGGEPDDKKPQPGELSSPKACAANPEFNVCLLPTPVQAAAGLNGHVWIDGGLKKVLDSADKRLPQWIVEVYDVSTLASGKTFTELVRGGGATRTTTTDAQGYYEVCGLEPNSIYRVLFRDPANRIAFPGVVTNEQGTATNADYWSQIKDREGFQVLEVKLPSSPGGSGCGGQGIAAPEQSLPLDPNGVVYDAKTRIPVPGAKVTLKPEGICTGYDPQLHIINNETYGHDAQGNPTMTTGDDGFYKFLLSGDPTAPQSCQFRLVVEQPVGYKPPPSTLIAANPLLQTPAAPGIYEVQSQKLAPAGNQSTTYHFLLMAGLAHREVFNNHIPLDPLIPGKLLLTKQGDKRLAEVGDTVLYTITVRLLEGDPVAQATVRDRLPAGFTLVRGTVRLNNLTASDPQGGFGPVLGFNLGPLQPNVEAKLTYRVRVGVGSMQGDGINRAQAHACQLVAGCLDPATLQALTGSVASNEAQHKVEVTGGVFTDNACLLGKVFVDCNNNHLQDAEELGIPGVRLYLENGQFMVSDSEGKYSRCGITPRSHVLTLDPSTLPRGAVLTTTSNRNLGDANSLFIDLKNGELHRGDFAEGSCSNPVLEQVKARRSQGEVRSVETEKSQAPALRFQSKPLSAPQQGTDSANQPLVQPRQGASDAR